MIKVLKYLKKDDLLLILLSLVFILCQVWLDLKLPDYMATITTLVQTEGSQIYEIGIAGFRMILCAMGSFAATFSVGLFVARIAAGLSMRLREMVYNKTMSFSMEELNGFSTASLITRSTNDITQIQSFLAMGMQSIVKAPILAVWAMIKIAGKSWEWTAVTAGAVLLLVAMLGTIMAFVVPKFEVIQTLTDSLNRVTRENLTGIRVVHAYNAQQYQEKRFQQTNEALTKTNLFTNRLMNIMQPGMSLIMSGLTLAIYFVGIFIIQQAATADKLPIFSDMVVFSSYATQVIMAFMMLTMTFVVLPRASVSANRVNEVLDTQTKIKDGTQTVTEASKSGTIEFRHVSFQYPDASDAVLHDISFQAAKGETVALIGSTGSGKSTLLNLIPRFYDATEGEILVDGIDVKAYTQTALRSKLGYVPQKSILFRGTIASNVAFGGNTCGENEEDALNRALHLSQANGFVEKMEGKSLASVSQGGTNVSGGQKQRIAIARAIYRRPEIYLFDDSFSALDYKTDRLLRSALEQEPGKTTTILVAQRIGTIIHADKILVLDEGRIVGCGTHSELLKTCTVYKEIAESQLSKEELEYA